MDVWKLEVRKLEVRKYGQRRNNNDWNRQGSGRRALRARAAVPERSSQRAQARDVAVAEGSVRDDGGGDPDVALLRLVSVRGGSGVLQPRAVDLPPLRSVMTDVATKSWYIVHTYS